VDAEALRVVDRTARDLWVQKTAGTTLDRLIALGEALSGDGDERAATTLRLYGTTEEAIRDMAGMVRTALAVVRPGTVPGDIGFVPRRDILLDALEEEGGTRGVPVEDAVAAGVRSGLSAREARAALEELLAAGECYQPASGMVKLI
jgi:hypothetical protein